MKEHHLTGTPVIFFKSLNRPFNVLGVDRPLFFLFVGLSIPIAFSGRLRISMDLLAIITFMVLYIIGVLMTRVDNQILVIYRRHIHYRKYYAATPGIHAALLRVKPSVPLYEGKRGLV